MKNKKSLGQHWLKNREILEYIASEAFDGSKICLEIGPGLGTLTSSLLKRFEKVVAVEFDAELARKLPGSFPGKNLEVINEDFLKFDLSKMSGSYTVAGNIPYYITSPIIEKLITAENAPEKIVLLIQEEVAERITAEKETTLSLMVKNRAEVFAGRVVPREEFTPPPKVDSEVIILVPHPPVVSEAVVKFIRVGFSAPRKKLIHNLEVLKSREVLARAFSDLGLNPDARPADLHLEDYRRLFESML